MVLCKIIKVIFMKSLLFLWGLLFIIITLSSCSNNTSSPSQFTLSGVVLDSKTSLPIANALISTNPASQSIFTDSLGKYLLRDLNEGTYAVIAKKYGYYTDSIKIDGNEKSIIGNIALTPRDTTIDSTNDTTSLPVDSGYVAYYKFNGNLQDESSNHLDGYTASPAYGYDRHSNVNSAYFVNNDDSIVIISDYHSLDLLGDFTIGFWVNPNSTQPRADEWGNIDLVAKWDNYALNTSSYAVTLMSNFTICVTLYNGSSSQKLITTQTVQPNSWTYITVVFKNNNMKIYFNANLSKSSTFSIKAESSNLDLSIGGRESGLNKFYGYIDDLVIYKIALSDNEILNWYNK